MGDLGRDALMPAHKNDTGLRAILDDWEPGTLLRHHTLGTWRVYGVGFDGRVCIEHVSCDREPPHRSRCWPDYLAENFEVVR